MTSLPKGGVEGILDLDRFDTIAGIGEVAGHYRCRERDRGEVGASELDEELGVAHLDGAEVVGVDDGRIGEDGALRVGEQGVEFVGLVDEAVFPALWVLAQDLGEGHRPVTLQRHKAHRIGGDSLVMDRPLDDGRPVDSHGDGAALAAEVPAELLLGLDDVLEHRVGDGLARDEESCQEGPHVLDAGLDDHPARRRGGFPLAGEEGIVGTDARLADPHRPRQAGGGPVVGAFGVVELDLDGALVGVDAGGLALHDPFVELGLGAGELFLEFGVAPAAAEEGEEEALVHFYLGHIGQPLTLSSRGEGARSRCRD